MLLGPEARYEQTESISLAFVTALQILPPRQLAVLILRDAPDSPTEDAIVAKFVRAYESGDVGAAGQHDLVSPSGGRSPIW